MLSAHFYGSVHGEHFQSRLAILVAYFKNELRAIAMWTIGRFCDLRPRHDSSLGENHEAPGFLRKD